MEIENNSGWVYLIKSGKEHYKVGIAKGSISARIAVYRTHNPHRVTLEHIVYVTDYKFLEKQIHKLHFSDSRGYWAKLTQKRVEIITNFMAEFEKDNAVKPNYKLSL